MSISKERYLKVKTKNDFIDLMDDFDQSVQEIFYCEEFMQRVKGTGYRG